MRWSPATLPNELVDLRPAFADHARGVHAAAQGLTLVHCSAQCNHVLSDTSVVFVGFQ